MQDAQASSAMALLKRLFDAETACLESGDSTVLRGVFHPDVVVHEPASLPYAGEWRGLDGIAALFRRMSETWSEMSVQNMTAARADDTVLMTCRLTLVARRNGTRIEQPFAEALRFEDGMLRDGIPFYHDTGALVAALAGASDVTAT